MARPWKTLDRVQTADGPLELRRRGDHDFLITIDGRVLMNSALSRSELAVARLACEALADRAEPRVLIGGLGLGLSLRAALDALPAGARVTVAELTPVVRDWCRGPARTASGDALGDPRVRVVIEDVARIIARAAGSASEPAAGSASEPAAGSGSGSGSEIESDTSAGADAADGDWATDPRFDAIVLDLYEGPHEATQDDADPFYGAAALARTRGALRPGGVLSVWSEEPDAAFARRLAAAGFEATLSRPGKGGRRHAVYLGRVPSGY
jgi:spermidine synthase